MYPKSRYGLLPEPAQKVVPVISMVAEETETPVVLRLLGLIRSMYADTVSPLAWSLSAALSVIRYFAVNVVAILFLLTCWHYATSEQAHQPE